MPMKNPAHPGRAVRGCLDELNLSVTDAAAVLDETRPMLSRVINGKSAISPEMSLRLSKAFGSTPEMWLRMQTAYDLAQARLNEDAIRVIRYEPKEPEVIQSSLGI